MERDMRIDSVEIKVTLAGQDASAAISVLGLPPDRPVRPIHFCEDVTRETVPVTPLLDAGIVLRIRQKSDANEFTVKLRPCRRSQLTSRWLSEDSEGFKVEADWSGSRRVLATSFTASLPDGRSVRAGDDGDAVRGLFTDDQVAFLEDCAVARVNLSALTVLPPVSATRWKEFPIPGRNPEFAVRAERWVVDTLDFLELSIAVQPAAAEASQAALEENVASRGLAVDDDQETKTRRVLETLVAAVR
jgi:hypothetical protein